MQLINPNQSRSNSANYALWLLFTGQVRSLFVKVSLLFVPAAMVEEGFSITSIELECIDDKFGETTDLGVFTFPISMFCIIL
jgi:hypothetical protein